MNAAFHDLRDALVRLFRQGADTPISDDDFDRVARDVFGWQFDSNPPYRRFCEARGVTPATLPDWTGIPAVPATAFKHLDLVSGDPATVERTFRTSGTTAGATMRGRHPVPSLDLYREASLPGIRRWLVPDLQRLPVVSLVADVSEAPESSLATMIDFAISEFGSEASASFADPVEGVRDVDLQRHLEMLAATGAPVLIAGTAFAFVLWLDRAAAAGWSIELPAGSRVMETGGFKGRSRAVDRSELYAMIGERLGVPSSRIVNEYGMTELLSQFWEPVLEGGPRRHVAAPWLRTRVVDPIDLSPMAPGEAGILLHFDLANAGSVSAVLTEDRGILHPDGLELLGREAGAEPRGCSMTMEDFLEANRT